MKLFLVTDATGPVTTIYAIINAESEDRAKELFRSSVPRKTYGNPEATELTNEPGLLTWFEEGG